MTALIRVALLAGAALAPHVALEFVDRRPLRPPDVDPNMYSRDLDPIPHDRADLRG